MWYWLLQVRAAAEEYHAEFAAKEATILTLTHEAEATRAHMQAEIEKLRAEMEVRIRRASCWHERLGSPTHGIALADMLGCDWVDRRAA